MRYYYDCEFLEDGRTIDLISIGIVAEDGREYYAVNADAPWKRIRKNDWLMANVVRYLPRGHGDYRLHMPKSWLVDFNDPRVKPKALIAAEVRQFLLDPLGDVEMWGWYSAYDHVVLAQLFGRMIDLPNGVPMWTNDLRQEVHRLGNPRLPDQGHGEHNALEDARHLKVRAKYLAARAALSTPTRGDDMSRIHTPSRIGGVERLLRQFSDKRWPYLPEYYLINRRTCGLGRWAALLDARRASLWIRDLPRETEPHLHQETT